MLVIKGNHQLIKRIQFLKNKNYQKNYLRLMVEGGGCSGFQYIFKMDDIVNPDDIVLKMNSSDLVVDKLSLPYLEGAVVDYKDTMIRSAFIIKENPKAEISCSCGSSFSPKINKLA
jgi:iron-sulfur cluster assembly accessory protein